MLRHIFTQGAIDACLIALAVRRMVLEPRDQVGVDPQRELLLDGPKKHAAPRTAPVADFRHVPRIDVVVWQRRQGLNLGMLRGREPLMIRPTSSPVSESGSGQVCTTNTTTCPIMPMVCHRSSLESGSRRLAAKGSRKTTCAVSKLSP